MRTEIDEFDVMFRFDHLREGPVRNTSQKFAELYEQAKTLPRNRERTMTFRKLLEAKDCAVRAVIIGEE